MAKRLEGTTAEYFVKEGAKVVIGDIQDKLGNSVCKEIGTDEEISYVHCDVSKDSDVQHLVDTTIVKHGKLDIMFSNAGACGTLLESQISAVGYDNFKKVFDVNVFGALACAKHAARVMFPDKKDSIIFTSSVASVTHGAVSHNYLASKYAVVGLTKNLCVELGQHGIRVNRISPFGVATLMLREGMGGLDKKMTEELVCAAANLKGTTLVAEDIAKAALYLASDESKYVSGLNLVMDGGYSTTNLSLEMTIKSMLS